MLFACCVSDSFYKESGLGFVFIRDEFSLLFALRLVRSGSVKLPRGKLDGEGQENKKSNNKTLINSRN